MVIKPLSDARVRLVPVRAGINVRSYRFVKT